ncbi:unnamed protein product, partial [Mesorhabditis belari]|uniref:Uncharacterized protein n=1 Tax=Mesorhabditis belari TaxID=2138241 RepID=A0AAF3FP13_9BILA
MRFLLFIALFLISPTKAAVKCWVGATANETTVDTTSQSVKQYQCECGDYCLTGYIGGSTGVNNVNLYYWSCGCLGTEAQPVQICSKEGNSGNKAYNTIIKTQCLCGNSCAKIFFEGNYVRMCGCNVLVDNSQRDFCSPPKNTTTCCTEDLCNAVQNTPDLIPEARIERCECGSFCFAGHFVVQKDFHWGCACRYDVDLCESPGYFDLGYAVGYCCMGDDCNQGNALPPQPSQPFQRESSAPTFAIFSFITFICFLLSFQ